MRYEVVFDEVVKIKLQKAITKSDCRQIIKAWLDELEDKGPTAGKLLDNHVWLYELKNKHPPLRLYFHHQKSTDKIIIFGFEMKTNEKKQKETIGKLRYNISKFLNLFLYTPFFSNYPNSQEGVGKVWYYEVLPLHFLISYFLVPIYEIQIEARLQFP